MFKEHAKHDFNLTKSCSGTLTSVAQLLGHCPAKQRVTSLIPSQGKCLGYGFGWRTDQCFFPSLSPSHPISLKIKINK